MCHKFNYKNYNTSGFNLTFSVIRSVFTRSAVPSHTLSKTIFSLPPSAFTALNVLVKKKTFAVQTKVPTLYITGNLTSDFAVVSQNLSVKNCYLQKLAVTSENIE